MFSFKKKKFDQTSCKYSVFETFFVRRVMFWIRNFKGVRLRAIFLQLDNFALKILESARFRTNKFDNGSDFEVNLICKKTDFDECFVCRMSFLELLITQNHKFCSYLLSQKPWYGEKMDKKQFFNEKIWKESDSETSFYNASDFESRISKYVRFSVNFKQLVIFGIGIFTACQILKHLFSTRQILIRNVNNFFATPQVFIKKIKNFVSKCKLNIHIASEIESRLLPRIKFRWKNCF